MAWLLRCLLLGVGCHRGRPPDPPVAAPVAGRAPAAPPVRVLDLGHLFPASPPDVRGAAPVPAGLKVTLETLLGCRGGLGDPPILLPADLSEPLPDDGCLTGVESWPPPDAPADWDAWRAGLEAAFPTPRVRITLENPSATPAVLAPILVWAARPWVAGDCEGASQAGRSDLRARRVPVPPLPPGATVQLWLKIPDYDLEYGVYLADSDADAGAFLGELAAPWTASLGTAPLAIPPERAGRTWVDGPGPDLRVLGDCR